MRNGHVPVGFWRAPGQQNAFYRECFIDELARGGGQGSGRIPAGDAEGGRQEPPGARSRGEGRGLGHRALPAGVHRGVAVADGFGSYAAMVAEVSVSAAGEPRVHRIVVAIDSGYVVNPDTCRAQAESNVVFGLGSILYQENNVKDGRVVESNFHDFPLPRIAEMPKVETVLVPTRRLLGRPRRAGHPSADARRVQRDLRRHRQAHPLAAAQAPRPAPCLSSRQRLRAAARLFFARAAAIASVAALRSSFIFLNAGRSLSIFR